MKIPEAWLTNDFKNEEQFQAAAIMMMSKEFPQLRDKFWHTKNELFIPKKDGEEEEAYKLRAAREMNKYKSLGLLAGVMDILFLLNGILYKVELKQPNGTLQPSQKKIHAAWNADCPQIPVAICYTISEVYFYVQKVIKRNLKIDFEW